VERTIPYGRFALVEPRGATFAHVLVAPEYVLLQRSSHSSVRDVSYLVVWSAARIAAVARELAVLTGESAGVLDAQSRELHAILRAIAPAATPIHIGGGECQRTLRTLLRRRFDAQLRAAFAATVPLVPSGRKVS
jgi:hypothetical protein